MAVRRWCAADRQRLWSETERKRTQTSINTTQRSFWDKNEEKWWTTEPWPRRWWPWWSSGEVSSRRSGQCRLTKARQPQPTRRRCCGEASGALDGVAWPETLRRERASLPKQRWRRGEDDRRERGRTRVEMAQTTWPGAPWRAVGHAEDWRAGPMATYGRHESRHAASPVSSPLLTVTPFSLWSRLKLDFALRLTPNPFDDFAG